MALVLKPKKITALPEATTLDGSEYFPIAQAGVTRKVLGTVIRQFLGGGGGTDNTAITEYIDTHDAATLATAEAFATTADQNVLNQANAYTDANSGAGGVSEAYVDLGDATTLDSATAYSDANRTTAINTAEAFATAADTVVLNTAKAYADTLVVGLATTTATNTAIAAGDLATLNSAKAYADTVGGGAGNYNSGGSTPELAPALGTWTPSGTVPPTQDGSAIHFVNSSNTAVAIGTAAMKDNTSYDVSFTISNYVTGSVRVALYGATTGHQGVSSPARAANGNYTATITTTGTSSFTNQIRIQAMNATANTYDITAISVKESGGATGIVRTMQEKVTEIEVSVLDYGADDTGVTDSTAAFNSAIHSGAVRVKVPKGTYKVDSVIIDVPGMEFYGEGRNNTHINCTTTTGHGMWLKKNTSGGDDLFIVRDFHLHYTGAGQPITKNWSGLYLSRKAEIMRICVEGFTNDGIFFAPWDSDVATNAAGLVTRAVFFAKLDSVWSKSNGRAGCNLRYGCNANTFINCDFSNNGLRDITNGHGLWQHLDGSGTIYGNTFISGQCSYNAQRGWNWEEGFNVSTMGLYAEGNGYDGTNGYINTLFDFYISNTIQRALFYLGVLNTSGAGADAHLRLPTVAHGNVEIWECGNKKYPATAT